MAFLQFKFDQVTFQSRDIFNTYIYETDDTIAEVLTTGYFDACRFAQSDDWAGSIIQCKCSDTYAEVYALANGATELVMPAAADVTKAVQKLRSYKHSASHSQNLLVGGGGETYLMMVMLPVQYTSVRIGYTHLGGSGNVTAAKAIIASSDNIGDLSYNPATTDGRQFIFPTKAGTVYNDISFNGWKELSWSGSSTLTIADPGAGERVTVFSDLIDITSLNLANGSFTGYSPLLIRVYAGTGVRTITNNFTGQLLPQYFIDAGNNIIMNASKSGGDHVTDPSTWSVFNTPSFSSAGNMPLTIEVYTANDSKSVMCVGDSRLGTAATSDAATAAYKTLTWNIEKDLNANGIKANVVASAIGGYTTNEYFDLAIGLLGDGDLSATDAVYLIYSINDGLPTDEVIANAKAKAIRFIQRCIELNITPLLMTSFPRSSGYTSAQLINLASVEQMALNTGYKVISPLSIYGDENGAWTGFNADADHMTSAGYADLSSKVASLMAE